MTFAKPALPAVLLPWLFQHTGTLQTSSCSPPLWHGAATSAPALAVRRAENPAVTHSHLCHTRDGCVRCTPLSRPAGVASSADHDIRALHRLHFTTAQERQRVGLERTEKQYTIFYLYWKNHEKTGGEDPAFRTQCLNSGEGHWWPVLKTPTSFQWTCREPEDCFTIFLK